MDDSISRQDAIRIVDGIDTWQAGWRGYAIESLKALPSSQPEVAKDTNVPINDTISRQAAIDAFKPYADYESNRTNADWVRRIELVLNDLPSAQPEKAQLSQEDATFDCISRQAAINAIENTECELLSEEWNEITDAIMSVPSAQPELIWGLHASVGRPLGDREIVPRLREIQKQIGGSYAIDRAVEVIEAIAERRTDDRE